MCYKKLIIKIQIHYELSLPGVQLCREKGSILRVQGMPQGKHKAATSHRCVDGRSSASPPGTRARRQEERGVQAGSFGKFWAAVLQGFLHHQQLLCSWPCKLAARSCAP